MKKITCSVCGMDFNGETAEEAVNRLDEHNKFSHPDEHKAMIEAKGEDGLRQEMENKVEEA